MNYQITVSNEAGKMRVLVLLFMILHLSASRLISSDEIGNIFNKFIHNATTIEEFQTLKDAAELFHQPEHASGRSFETSSQARASLMCLVCRSAATVVFKQVRSGQPAEVIADSLARLCSSIGIVSQSVCYGAIALNMPIFNHIIKTVPEATPEAFCGLVLQSATDPNVCPFHDPRFEWQVKLPEKSAVPTEPLYDSKPFKAVVMTDAHIDPLYEAYGVAECDAPTCCRKGQTPQRFSFRSDITEPLYQESIVEDIGEVKLNLSVASEIGKQRWSRSYSEKPAPAGYWGDYRNCDTPIWAYDDAIEHIHETHQDIDVIYYVGDTIDHGVWETSYELINDMNKYFIKKLRTTFGDNVKVIPTMGNHESQPTNQFAPSRVVGEKLNTTWLYKALAGKWDFYLTEDAKNTLLEHGSFSMLIRPGLRVISFNNNVAYTFNWWLVYDPLDAKKHLDWLVEELHKAELAGERVHILAHIPPGRYDLTHTWTREYNRIVNRFSETIAAEFNGHTHADEFRIFYSPGGSPINVAWGAGSVTAYTFYNLNYKIVNFNEQSFVPERILTYTYNLTEANLTPNRRPHWFLLYDMKNSFALPDLSAQSMHNLVHSMVKDNRRLLHFYAAFNSRISDVRWPNCDDNCKIDILCQTVVTVLWERQRCEELKQQFFRNTRY